MKELIEHFLQPEEVEEFACWAFGDEYFVIKTSKAFLNAWNSLHQDALYLKSDGVVKDDIQKMVQLWKDSKVKT